MLERLRRLTAKIYLNFETSQEKHQRRLKTAQRIADLFAFWGHMNGKLSYWEASKEPKSRNDIEVRRHNFATASCPENSSAIEIIFGNGISLKDLKFLRYAGEKTQSNPEHIQEVLKVILDAIKVNFWDEEIIAYSNVSFYENGAYFTVFFNDRKEMKILIVHHINAVN